MTDVKKIREKARGSEDLDLKGGPKTFKQSQGVVGKDKARLRGWWLTIPVGGHLASSERPSTKT